ncbi:unnamed protein product [Hymenolepis diminuta]|uniref:Uncharacterized protein n=1 Tax=Hymenolepis diminuta TaxID=6216 RepID=A0A564Z9S6_HYMDI|nr:unnamed protein product [Hymenolepis diminuta]
MIVSRIVIQFSSTQFHHMCHCLNISHLHLNSPSKFSSLKEQHVSYFKRHLVPQREDTVEEILNTLHFSTDNATSSFTWSQSLESPYEGKTKTSHSESIVTARCDNMLSDVNVNV